MKVKCFFSNLNSFTDQLILQSEVCWLLLMKCLMIHFVSAALEGTFPAFLTFLFTKTNICGLPISCQWPHGCCTDSSVGKKLVHAMMQLNKFFEWIMRVKVGKLCFLCNHTINQMLYLWITGP